MVQYHTHALPTATKSEAEAGTRDDVALSPASLNGAELPIIVPDHTHTTAAITGLDAALADRVEGTVRLTVASTAPSAPAVNDVWIDTT
jgi:hypothetical protein